MEMYMKLTGRNEMEAALLSQLRPSRYTHIHSRCKVAQFFPSAGVSNGII
jgi:hypothetical protein